MTKELAWSADEAEHLEVRLGIQRDPNVVAKSNDPFDGDVSKLHGLNDTARKRKSRALSKRATGREGASSKTRHEEVKELLGYSFFNVARPKFDLANLQELFTKDDTNFAAVRAKASNVVGLGFDLIDSNGTRRRKDKVSDDIEKKQALEARLQNEKFKVLDFIDTLNEEDDFLEIIEKVYTDYENTGNGYLEVGRTAFGFIGYIGHVPAATMRVRLTRDGFVQMVNDRPVFFRNFGDHETIDPIGNDPQPNEIIHFKKYNPIDLYYGMPDVIPAINAIAGNAFSDSFNLDYFENKAVPRHLVVVKGGKFSSGAQFNILKFFDEDLRGKHHRTLYLELPPDSPDRKHSINIEAIEGGSQEASFSLYSKRNTERILMAHRVPMEMLGMSGGGLGTARQADKSFKELTVRPAQRKFEKRLNRIIHEFTDLFNFKFNELTLTDEVAQATIDQTYLDADVILPNEVRARWGWPGLPDGDKTNAQRAKESEVAAQKAKSEEQERKYQAENTRARDRERNANRTDSVGEARNTQGEGRTTS